MVVAKCIEGNDLLQRSISSIVSLAVSTMSDRGKKTSTQHPRCYGHQLLLDYVQPDDRSDQTRLQCRDDEGPFDQVYSPCSRSTPPSQTFPVIPFVASYTDLFAPCSSIYSFHDLFFDAKPGNGHSFSNATRICLQASRAKYQPPELLKAKRNATLISLKATKDWVVRFNQDLDSWNKNNGNTFPSIHAAALNVKRTDSLLHSAIHLQDPWILQSLLENIDANNDYTTCFLTSALELAQSLWRGYSSNEEWICCSSDDDHSMLLEAL